MIDLNDFKHFETTSNGRVCRSKKYMGYCSECGGPRGYIFKAEDGKICKKCIQPRQTATLAANKDKGIEASANLRRGQPSPKKGIKTGKPAWNRGEFFDNETKKVVRGRMSRRMRHALHGRNMGPKSQHVFDILGYSADDLMKHLESKFEPGMTWENIGEWHIDHVTPDSWFNYSSVEDQAFIDCWSLNNLQPMWKPENMSKGNRYSGSYKSGGY